MKLVVFNLGCKVNQYESDMLLQEFEKLGYEVSGELRYADIYVLNTCAVTGEAERKSRQAIQRCKRYNPSARIIVCGCASQHNPQSFCKERVEYISGVRNKKEIINAVENHTLGVNVYPEMNGYDAFSDVLHRPDRTRAYVKIQDGCNNFCSYCLIPYLRGRSVSRKPEDILLEISALKGKTEEVVLTGINLMEYGKDISTSLVELVALLKNIPMRFRLGSFYVEGLTRELLEVLFANGNFCPQFHLSLQSGDDNVLRKMNRHYSTSQYSEKINLIREFDKNAAITTDIIVGFPTESDEEFSNTVKFVSEVAFADIHVFPFSLRKGTRAEQMQQVPKNVIDARKEILLAKKSELQHNYLVANIGIPQQVLFEGMENGMRYGYSERYIRVFAATNDTEDKLISVVIPTEVYQNYALKGEIK